MEWESGPFEGVVVFRPAAHVDDRGFFVRTFDDDVARSAGVDPAAFVQDSQSRSRQGVVRGLHGRVGQGEAKLVRVAHGAVLDVVVDVRPGSATFGTVATIVLDDVDHVALYLPRGMLHGHQTLTPTADVCYRIDALHDPLEDVAVHHLDPDLAVAWPQPVTLVSERDGHAGSWAELVARLDA